MNFSPDFCFFFCLFSAHEDFGKWLKMTSPRRVDKVFMYDKEERVSKQSLTQKSWAFKKTARKTIQRTFIFSHRINYVCLRYKENEKRKKRMIQIVSEQWQEVSECLSTINLKKRDEKETNNRLTLKLIRKYFESISRC